MIHPYIPHTPEDREAMLGTVGVSGMDDLYRDIPREVRQKGSALPTGISEMEAADRLEEMASRNASGLVCFRGGGVYDHYIPALVDHVVSRSEFYTAYTPYQPEISQGTLQYIFEYQSMMAELTGMDAVNASLYDGSTAAAEAMIMAFHATRRRKALLSETVNPGVVRVLKTYARFHGINLKLIPSREGRTDPAALKEMMERETGVVLAQSPNYYGLVEDISPLAEEVHLAKGLFVQIADPLSLALLKPPGEGGADIAVGEAQSLGLPLNFGGPYLGFMGTTKKLMRKLPGRLCGQTTDREGKRAFVLTLQAREQHIRREKATSNICSNQSLCSLAAAVYMAAMGREGLREAAEQSLGKADYAARALCGTGKWEMAYRGPFFREFALKPSSPLSEADSQRLEEALTARGLLGGIPLGSLGNGRLIAVTEKRSRAQIDRLAEAMGGIR